MLHVFISRKDYLNEIGAHLFNANLMVFNFAFLTELFYFIKRKKKKKIKIVNKSSNPLHLLTWQKSILSTL